jgi:hypothetical protein
MRSDIPLIAIPSPAAVTGMLVMAVSLISCSMPEHPSSTGQTLAEWNDLAGSVESVVTIIALLMGAIWAYFKVLRGRVYTSRLEPTVKGTLYWGDNFQVLVVETSLTNVGLTRVFIDRNDSSIEVLSYPIDHYSSEFHEAITTRLGTVDGVERHEWIEPGECIREQKLIAVPREDLVALIVKFRILPRRRWVRKRTEWNAVAVVPCRRVCSHEREERNSGRLD